MNFRKIDTDSVTFIMGRSLLAFLIFLAIILLFGSCRSHRALQSETASSASQTHISRQQIVEALTDSMLAQLNLDFDTLEFYASSPHPCAGHSIADHTLADHSIAGHTLAGHTLAGHTDAPDSISIPATTRRIRIVNGKVRSHCRTVSRNASVTQSQDSVTTTTASQLHVNENASRDNDSTAISLLAYIIPLLIFIGVTIYVICIRNRS